MSKAPSSSESNGTSESSSISEENLKALQERAVENTRHSMDHMARFGVKPESRVRFLWVEPSQIRLSLL